MIICNLNLHLELLYVESLKGRRAVINSLKEKLKKFNLSVLDVSSEYVKEADIAIVYLAPNKKESAKIRESIENLLIKSFSEYSWDIDYEEF